MTKTIMEERQQPLGKRYGSEPQRAWVTDVATTVWRDSDPLHSQVALGPAGFGPEALALHEAVGGDGDGPVPGDLLCAALAGCLDSTLRVVADRLHVSILHLSVRATAEVDVRGTLCLDAEVPIAFQRMDVEIDLQIDTRHRASTRQRLLETAEHCCVVYQTLRVALPIEIGHANEQAESA